MDDEDHVLWSDTLLIQIPLLGGKYHYLCAVQGPDHLKIYYLLDNERQARNEILEYLQPINSECDIFVDVGGYIGSWTLPMSVVKPKTVYVFEPSIRHAINIQDQINVNNRYLVDKLGDRVKIITKALGNDKMKKLSIDDLMTDVHYDYQISGVRTDEKSIDVITFDEFVLEYRVNINHIRLIKIDVEGWELAVLNGMNDFLSKYHPELIVECHPYIDDNTGRTEHMKPLVTEYLSCFGYKIKKDWSGIYWYSIN